MCYHHENKHGIIYTQNHANIMLSIILSIISGKFLWGNISSCFPLLKVNLIYWSLFITNALFLQMRLYLSNFAHLLVIVAVFGVTLGSPLTFVLLTNTSYTRANVESSTANRLKYDVKPPGEKKVYIIDEHLMS